MKTSIMFVIVAALSVMFTVEWASAQGNHRGAIDRKWQQVRAWQERQDKKFKAIEREGERPLRKMDGSKGPLPIIH
jgi:hypothetical protein